MSPRRRVENPLVAQQQVLGNQALQRLLLRGGIQDKPKIDHAGDKYEQEADRVAGQVMQMPEPSITESGRVSGQVMPPSIQRLCRECEEEEELQRQPIDEEEEEEEILQAKVIIPRVRVRASTGADIARQPDDPQKWLNDMTRGLTLAQVAQLSDSLAIPKKYESWRESLLAGRRCLLEPMG